MNILSSIGTNVIVSVGIPGPAGADGAAAAADEGVTAGMAGVSIPVAGFTLPADYQVSLTYLEDPGGNGVLFAEKTAAEFTVKHHGTHHVAFSYAVFATGAA